MAFHKKCDANDRLWDVLVGDVVRRQGCAAIMENGQGAAGAAEQSAFSKLTDTVRFTGLYVGQVRLLNALCTTQMTQRTWRC